MPLLEPVPAFTETILSGGGADGQDVFIPGGWSATGQPNDGFHQHLHCLTHAYCAASVEWANSLDLRRTLDQLQMSVQSSATTKLLDS